MPQLPCAYPELENERRRLLRDGSTISFGAMSAAVANPAGLHKVVLAPDGAIVGYSWGGKRLAFRILPNSQIAPGRLILASGRAIAFNLRGKSASSTSRGGEYRLILVAGRHRSRDQTKSTRPTNALCFDASMDPVPPP